MKIIKIQVKNFRSLQNFSIDLEDDLSLIVGKNNTGKTSVIEVLDKFLNNTKPKIEPEDFNIDFLQSLKDKLKNDDNNNDGNDDKFEEQGIKLLIYIKYDENDNLANISNLMTTLDENNNIIVLEFKYVINEENFNILRKKYKEYTKQNKKADQEDYFMKFFKKNIKGMFQTFKRSIQYDINNKRADENIFVDIDDKSIRKVLSMKFISAKRLVDNNENNKTLSSQSSAYYNRVKDDSKLENSINEFNETIEKMDAELDKNYNKIFEDLIKKIKQFGCIKKDGFNLEVKSTLQQANLLNGNTTVYYNFNGEEKLPENYNGLGYLNLINIIFAIEIIINDFAKPDTRADINLLFIEEPEAHTHPQMQYIFIRNIKTLLSDSSKNKQINLQTVITTHSSHIVSQCEFENIKYFVKKGNNTKCKNISELEEYYTNCSEEWAKDENAYNFLKKYLTLNSAEIFFADKIILIEGETERILLPAIMKKMDNKCENEGEKLLSQDISIIEVGRYSKLFAFLIDFLEIKTLIITDIDFVSKDGYHKKLPADDINATCTSNVSLKYFFAKEIKNNNNKEIETLKNEDSQNRILRAQKDPETNKISGWIKDKDSFIMVQYQSLEENESYYPRSFEDDFISLNYDFIKKGNFVSFDNKSDIFESRNYYEIANKCVESKPSFAIEILLNCDEEYSNIKIPKYIKEGLEWLRK